MKKFLLLSLLALGSIISPKGSVAQSVSRNFPAKETDNIFLGKNQFTQGVRVGPKSFANLPADALDGTIIECPDCQATSPCLSGGTGAYAHRLNSVWSCVIGGGGTIGPGTIGKIPVFNTTTSVGDSVLSQSGGGILDSGPFAIGSAAIIGGCGTLANCSSMVDIESTIDGSGSATIFTNVYQSSTVTLAADSTKNFSSAIYTTIISDSNTHNFTGAFGSGPKGFVIGLDVGGSGSITPLGVGRGLDLEVGTRASYSSTITSLTGGYISMYTNGGNITNLRGLWHGTAPQAGTVTWDQVDYYASPGVTTGSTGVLTHHAAIYMEDQTTTSGGITNSDPYGIYQVNSSERNRLGWVGLGGVSPTAALDVNGNFKIDASGFADIKAITDPGNPGAGYCRLFADPSGALTGHKSDGTSCLAGGGGGGTPGGSTTQVQFNSAGAFAGSVNLTWVSPTLKIGVAGSVTGQLQQTGSISGVITITPQATAGTATLTYPNQSGTFAVSAALPIVENSASGALSCPTCAVTSGKLNQFAQTTSTELASTISDETGSTGVLVFNGSPTIITPTIASFINATHNHTNNVGGGQLTDGALATAVGVAKGGTNLTAALDDNIMIGNGTTWQSKAIPDCPDGTGHLNYTISTNTISCGVAGAGGSGANVNLSNLSGVAFNSDLVPDSATTRSLGSPGVPLASGYFGTSIFAPFLASNSGTVADAGSGALVRGANNTTLVAARNAANTGNCNFGLNSSDQFTTDCPFTSTGTATYIELGSETVATTGAVNTARISYNDSTGKLRVSLDAASPVTVITSAETADALATSTSAQMRTLISDETGTGSAVFANTPTLVTPILGVATATSINKMAITAPATSSTLAVADGKTFTVNNTMTLAGTDSQTYTFPTTTSNIFGSTTKWDVLTAGSSCTDAGSTDTYVCSLSPAITAYNTNTVYTVKVPTANTGAASINLNSLGAKTIVKYQGGVAQTLADNDIQAGAIILLGYDGTNMQLLSTLGNTSGGGSGDITDVGSCSTGACFTSGGTGNTLTFHNATSGTLIVQTVTGALGGGTISIPNATDTLMGKATTDTMTNKTYDTAGSGNSFSINSVAVTANTGTGAVARAAGPTFTTPILGVASATTLNKLTITAPATGSTLTILDGKTLTANNTLILAGTDSTTITFQGTDTYMGRATTDTVTNKTINAESTGNVLAWASEIPLPVASCQNATATLLWDTPATNPAVASCDTGTNTQKGTADFADGASSLSIQTSFSLPDDWTNTGGVDVKFKWFSSVTTGNVVWQIASACVADGSTSDPAYNTASTATDAVKGTTLQDNDAIITGITMTGCTAGSQLYVKVFRDPANASDTMAGTARLRGVTLKIRHSQ